MPTTVTSREFNQNVARAKRAAAGGPVFVTDRGEPAFVLLSMAEYRRIQEGGQTLLEALAGADPRIADIDFDPVRNRSFPRDINLD